MNENTSQFTTIDLLRHGEPEGGKKYRGQIDDPLTELGWSQMRNSVADHKPWHAVISSPLRRCHEFAQELSQRHDLPVQTDARLMEISFGEWEGCSANDLMKTDAEALFRFWSDPLDHSPPGAETLEVFEQRVISAWNEILSQHSGKHVLLVAHAGVIRMIIRHVLGMPLEAIFRLRIELAGLSRIEIEACGESVIPRLLFHSGQLT